MLTERERKLVEYLREQVKHQTTRGKLAMQAVNENTLESYQQFFIDVHPAETRLLNMMTELLTGILKELGDEQNRAKG
jgi:hypothetical protein